MITRPSGQETVQREGMRGGNGTVELTALSASLPGNARLFSKVRLAPGVSIGYHVHENETELFYFAAGHGIANDNGVPAPVNPGDCMLTGGGAGHAVENTGDEDLIIIAAIIKD